MIELSEYRWVERRVAGKQFFCPAGRLSVRQEMKAWDLADLRCGPKVAAGRMGTPWGKKQSASQTHEAGARAEVYVSGLFGCEPRSDYTQYGDDGIDFYLPDGRSVEVKFRDALHYEFALNRPDLKEFKAEIGVLALPYGEEILVHGFITKAAFVARKHPSNFGFGKRFVVSQEQMEEMRYLLPAALVAPACLTAI